MLQDVSEWNIEHFNEEQTFEKPDYGVKFVIPPSSVEIGQGVTTDIKLVAPEESEIILPPDVELVSCLYKIETKGKFSKSIELHLQHSIEIRSQEESQQLAFITAEGPPPYKFELVPIDINREFKPNKISGFIKVSDFIVVGAVKQKLESALCQQMSSSYTMTVFIKHILKSSWAIQAVITKNLGPFIKVQNLKMLTKIVLSLYNFYLIVYILYFYSVLESEHRERF